MERSSWRWLTAAAVAIGGVAAALLAGAPLPAALIALLAGIAAFALIPGFGSPQPTGLAAAADELDEPLPGMAELLRAVEEPLLIVRDRRVIAANAAAREVLGDHIEGADVRLAIRHPAAAERLAGAVTGETGRVELIGLGEADRQWAMTVTELPGGSRLVRLSDRSAARAAEQMRVDFVANASHELRTPLATLLGFLETLQDEDAAGDAETRARFLGIMLDEARRMRGLVDDLMSLSRIEAERYAVPRDPVDLVRLVEEVKGQLGQLIESRDASVTVDKPANGAVVAGDRPQLAQMLDNLLANALKYGRAGGEVRIRLEQSGDLVGLSIADQGEGIAPEHLPRLTERFYRVDTSRSRSVGGTGLGLAIVKHIVLRHRGRLDIRSELGEGTTVSVWLPRAHNDEV